jgi:hypothetical protein
MSDVIEYKNPMIMLTLEEIPSWLQSSFLYESLIENGDLNETTTISSRFIKDSSDIINSNDFIRVICAMSYWQPYRIPVTLKTALESEIINNVLYENLKDTFPIISYWKLFDVFSRKFIHNIIDFSDAVEAISYWDLEDDLPDCIIEFIYNTPKEEFDTIKDQFVNYPNIERFWKKVDLISKNSENESLTGTVLNLCRYDYYDCLRFFCLRASEFEKETGIQACLESVAMGKTKNLEILLENDYPFDPYLLFQVARGGHFDCLRWLHETYMRPNMCKCLPCSGAVQGGHLDCLRFLVENGYLCNDNTYRWAIEGGNAEIIEYVFTHK